MQGMTKNAWPPASQRYAAGITGPPYHFSVGWHGLLVLRSGALLRRVARAYPNYMTKAVRPVK